MPSPAMKLMTFPEAIEQLNNGQKVTRVEWNNNQEYGIFRMSSNGLVLMIRKVDGQYYLWIVNDGDTKAEDWIVVHDN